jgi:hypothetical protein
MCCGEVRENLNNLEYPYEYSSPRLTECVMRNKSYDGKSESTLKANTYPYPATDPASGATTTKDAVPGTRSAFLNQGLIFPHI